jgi:hypothetical protein
MKDIGDSSLFANSSTNKALWRVGEALLGVVDNKEYFEACEFYLRTRKRLRHRAMLDVCCGHGLAGLLFAAFEPCVESLVLVDHHKPESFGSVLAAVASVAPWTAAKVSFVKDDLCHTEAYAHLLLPTSTPSAGPVQSALSSPPSSLSTSSSSSPIVPSLALPTKLSSSSRFPTQHKKNPYADSQGRPSAAKFSGGVGVLGIHACGRRTDEIIDLACSLRAAVAVMPCCYTGKIFD